MQRESRGDTRARDRGRVDCMPSEGIARWQLQRSPPAQSEERPPEVWLPSLSDDERLVEEHAQSRGVEEPLVVGETRQPHFWWQILRLHWR